MIDWIYSFLGLRPVPLKAGMKPRNNNLASSEKKTKESGGIICSVADTSASADLVFPLCPGREKENPEDPVNPV